MIGMMRWVVSRFFIAIIVFYRLFISPLKRPSCRFYPSCSSYSLTLFKLTHPLYALFFSIIRISKCHPWCDGGYDYPLVHVKISKLEYRRIECSYWMIPKDKIEFHCLMTKPIHFWAYILLKD
ncbi:membrane protein insertion efficiency factor YidD [Helicobacter pametensis]|uniref:membrane protein insertion efficiency factor YidD n=2 Tax=Helicobacter pametensis TaxID=95149 RepID=UPI003B82CBA6